MKLRYGMRYEKKFVPISSNMGRKQIWPDCWGYPASV